MKDAALVSRNLNVTDQSRVAPDAERVVREATGADNLAVVGAPAERCHLRTSINAVDSSTRGRVPEMDVTIVGAATGGQQVHVPRAPGESLDGSLVVGLGKLGNGQRTGIPDRNQVVVAASSKLGAV